MKIAVTCRGKTLDDQVDPRFGRCPYFLVVDTDTLDAEPIENPNLALGGGAGIQSKSRIHEQGRSIARVFLQGTPASAQYGFFHL